MEVLIKVVVKTKDLSREDWLKYRTHGIGGSDVSIIAGINLSDDLTFQIDENGTPVSKLELSVPMQREERSFKLYNSVSGGEHTVERQILWYWGTVRAFFRRQQDQKH